MFIGIDIGGTNSRVAAFNSLTDPQISDVITFAHTGYYGKDLKNIISAIRKLTNQIDGIGISLAGVLDEEKTYLKVSSNLPSWMGQPITSDLKSIFDCPVFMENDGVATALGESLYGYGRDQSFVLMIWGTGIGGTSVDLIDGKRHMSAIEPGHAPQDWNGGLCSCGQRGCYEITCGGAGIAKKYGKPAQELSDEQWDEVLDNFAGCLMNLVMLRPPKLIVFTGTVAVRQAKRLPKLQAILQQRLKVYDVPELKISKFEAHTGLYGALGLLKDRVPSKKSL